MLRIEEKELVRRTLDGDLDAFSRLYRTHHPRIYATLIGRTRNRDDAEDLVQVTFMRAYRGLSGFRGEAAFSTWLTQIAINICTTHLRAKQARRSWHEAIEAPGSEYREVWEPTGCESSEDLLQWKECEDLLMSGIEGLPGPYREAMWLRFVKERTYVEITEELQVPMGTVKTWIYRARRQLKEALEGESV